MTKKVALAGIGLVLLVGVGWLWRMLSVRPAELPSTPAATGAQTTSDRAVPPAGRTELSQRPEERAPATESSPKAPQDAASFVIEGSVVVLDSSGGEHPNEDGFLSLRLEGAGDETWKRCDVAHGSWSVRASEGAKIRVGQMELGGRATVLENPFDTLAIPADHRLTLRARWPPSTLLHVRATDTQQELAGVELIRGMALASSGASDPGPYTKRDLLAASATSPIRLDELDKLDLAEGAQPYYARADRYAWGRIELDLSVGSEHELLLRPGGSLVVDLSGPMPPPNLAALLVRDSDSPRAWPEATRPIDGRASFLLESLAAGHHAVSVEIHGLDPASSLLGSGEAEVLAGSTAHLAITLREIPRTDKAPLEGVVVVPKDWRIDEFRLMAFPIGRSAALPGDEVPPLQSGSMRPVEGQPEAHAFSWPAVPLGSYGLTVLPPGWVVKVDVGPQGLRNARIELPSPALVSVRVVDLDLGVEAPIQELQWVAVLPEGVSGGYSFGAQKNTTTGRHEFSAPIGEIEIRVADPLYLPVSKRVTVGLGRNDLTIEVEQASGVVLQVHEGNVAVPFDDSNVSIEQVGGDGRSNWNSKEPGERGMKFAVTHPGRYRVEVRGLSGYKQTVPVVLDIEPGKFAEVVVQVERQP
jgi:hypothetical protein